MIPSLSHPNVLDVCYAPVRVNGKDMKPIPIADVGNYVVVLYDDPEGNIRTMNFRDFKYLSAD